jgi:hypothetical protein
LKDIEYRIIIICYYSPLIYLHNRVCVVGTPTYQTTPISRFYPMNALIGQYLMPGPFGTAVRLRLVARSSIDRVVTQPCLGAGPLCFGAIVELLAFVERHSVIKGLNNQRAELLINLNKIER